MQNREQLGDYLLPSAEPPGAAGRFDNPYDRLAFIESYAELFMVDARKGHSTHGRGMVMLQQAGKAFVKSWYAVPDPGEFDRLPEAMEDFEGYDPETELLVGILEYDGTFVGFWRTSPR